MSDFRSLSIQHDGPVATVKMRPLRISFTLEPYAEIHEEMGLAMSQLRVDESVRVVILTGEEDGEFLVPPTKAEYARGGQNSRLSDPASEWGRFTGCIRAHQAIAEMEKVVISKVNGDAFGFGQSLMFNSDFIVARPDAKVCDLHLSMGEALPTGKTERVGPQEAMVPGDGALSTAPFFMPPTMAKEYFLLGTEMTVEKLVQLGIVNKAVPLAQLDEATDVYVQAVLKRPREIIAFTKRVLNRRIVNHMSLTLDPALAYQLFGLRQMMAQKQAGTPEA